VPVSSRERLLSVLSGKVPDRVPVSPFVQDEYLSLYYPQKETVHRVYDAVELASELEFDLIAKPRDFEHPHFLRKRFPNWELREEREIHDGQLFVKRSIETPARTLTQVQVGPDAGAATAGVHLSTKEYLLKDREDIEAFIEYMPEIDADQIEFLKTASPEAVADRARHVMETGKPGGHYIFSTSDFLEKGTPIENVKAMIAAAKEAGGY
jgi:uroporphyrinogen decarboxylase